MTTEYFKRLSFKRQLQRWYAVYGSKRIQTTAQKLSECSPQGQEEGSHGDPRPQPRPFLTQAHTWVNDPVTEQPPFTIPRLSPALEDLKKWFQDQPVLNSS